VRSALMSLSEIAAAERRRARMTVRVISGPTRANMAPCGSGIGAIQLPRDLHRRCRFARRFFERATRQSTRRR